MSPPPTIVFTNSAPHHQKILWNEKARATASRLGYTVRLMPFGDPPPGASQWRAFFRDADAIITTWGAPRLDESVLQENSRLKCVAHAAGSVSDLVSPWLFERGVRVFSANREIAQAVARWGLMMTLVAFRQLGDYAQFGQRSGLHWMRPDYQADPRASTIGIWGFGDIAKALIGNLQTLQPERILVCDPYLDPPSAERAGVQKVAFEELLQASDILHLCQSLTRQTRHRVGLAELRSMRRGATLINAARAGLLQTPALLQVLREGHIRAILDTFDVEPLPETDPLRALPNVLLTPHCAGHENSGRFVQLMLEEIHRFFHNEPLQYEITRERAASMTSQLSDD